jgi:hypothetical protein
MGRMKDLIFEVKELLDSGMEPDQICEYLDISLGTMYAIVQWLESDDMK